MTIKQIISGLESNSEKEISKSLAALKTAGNSKVLVPLANLLLTTTNDPKVSSEILEVFSSLKDSSAVDEVMAIVKNDKYTSIRQQILATIWNTQLDYSYHIADFVEIACEGDLLEALDCLTIMEGLTGPYEERHVLECQLLLKEFVEDNTPKDERKMQMISEIAMLIKDFMTLESDDITNFDFEESEDE